MTAKLEREFEGEIDILGRAAQANDCVW